MTSKIQENAVILCIAAVGIIATGIIAYGIIQLLNPPSAASIQSSYNCEQGGGKSIFRSNVFVDCQGGQYGSNI